MTTDEKGSILSSLSEAIKEGIKEALSEEDFIHDISLQNIDTAYNLSRGAYEKATDVERALNDMAKYMNEVVKPTIDGLNRSGRQ